MNKKMKLMAATIVTMQSMWLAESCKKADNIPPSQTPSKYSDVVRSTFSVNPADLSVTTFAGSGNATFGDGTGTAASFNLPAGMAMDGSGTIFLADKANNRIRKITSAGVVTVFAGSGVADFADGNGTAAKFNQPTGVAFDGSGNLLVADSGNHCIRSIAPNGDVTVFAGVPKTPGFSEQSLTDSKFNGPNSVAVNLSTGDVYVTDPGNSRVRKIFTTFGAVATLAGNDFPGVGDGPPSIAQFRNPGGIVFDASTGFVYVADRGNSRICKISSSSGFVNTFAGSASGTAGFLDAVGTSAFFNSPAGLALDPTSGTLYVADAGNHRIRQVAIADGTVTTLAGDGNASLVNGPVAGAEFKFPFSLVLNSTGNIFIADQSNHRIRKIAPREPGVATFAGGSSGFADGNAATARFSTPDGLAMDAAGNIYIADLANYRIRKITPSGVVSTVAGNGNFGATNGPVATATFNRPTDVAVDDLGNIYVADNWNNQIRKITPQGVVSTLAGDGGFGYIDGPGATARFNAPFGLTVDHSGNVYVADTYNSRIRKITPNGVVSTVAGNGAYGNVDGPAASASFCSPMDVVADNSGNLYVSDETGQCIRKITAAGTVSTLAGSTGTRLGFNGTPGFADGQGTSARFTNPAGIAVDASGNLYVADQSNARIRKITPGGLVSTVAGLGTGTYSLAFNQYDGQGYIDGPLNVAEFHNPMGVVVDPLGKVYVGDYSNSRIRVVQ